MRKIHPLSLSLSLSLTHTHTHTHTHTQVTMDAKEIVLAVQNKNFLLVFDGVDEILAHPEDSLLFKGFLEMLLEGVPGLSIVCTCVAPMAVPYENIVGVTRLADGN